VIEVTLATIFCKNDKHFLKKAGKRLEKLSDITKVDFEKYLIGF
jgi:hypothetical protein